MKDQGIGISNLPNIYFSRVVNKGIKFNLMVIGSRGLGKTSFINNFIGKYTVKRNRMLCFTELPLHIEVSQMVVTEHDFNVDLEIIEVDGVGDNIDNEFYLQNFFKERFNEFDLNSSNDRRVHLCLYFIEPIDFIKKTDVYYMKSLSEYCNVIPVVAKSDMICEQDRESFINKFKGSLEVSKLSFFQNLTTPFFINTGELKQNEVAKNRIYSEYTLDFNFRNQYYKLVSFIFDEIVKLFNETQYFFEKYKIMELANEVIEKNPKSLKKEFLKKFEESKKEIEKLKNRLSKLEK
ncbi:CDC3 [Hepatospora eriocheir]|uniref:CDC3 n=1 Tax=Hepatospora eriocheir TaxID=1081669 RepID=A0A1X0QB78_9MICR|nr:CDC3 [Hepatospora eriocheir]